MHSLSTETDNCPFWISGIKFARGKKEQIKERHSESWFHRGSSYGSNVIYTSAYAPTRGHSVYPHFPSQSLGCLLIYSTALSPASILLKSISDRYRTGSNAVGPMTVRYRLKQNASWGKLIHFQEKQLIHSLGKKLSLLIRVFSICSRPSEEGSTPKGKNLLPLFWKGVFSIREEFAFKKNLLPPFWKGF